MSRQFTSWPRPSSPPLPQHFIRTHLLHLAPWPLPQEDTGASAGIIRALLTGACQAWLREAARAGLTAPRGPGEEGLGPRVTGRASEPLGLPGLISGSLLMGCMAWGNQSLFGVSFLTCEQQNTEGLV